jgi:hypothetical protein
MDARLQARRTYHSDGRGNGQIGPIVALAVFIQNITQFLVDGGLFEDSAARSRTDSCRRHSSMQATDVSASDRPRQCKAKNGRPCSGPAWSNNSDDWLGNARPSLEVCLFKHQGVPSPAPLP